MKTAYKQGKPIISNKYLFNFLIGGGIIKSKTSSIFYKLDDCNLLQFDSREVWLKSDKELDYFTQSEFFEMEEIQEPTPPKFTPENINKVWVYGEGYSCVAKSHAFNISDSHIKLARLATPEEIQAECDRLNKICEEK